MGKDLMLRITYRYNEVEYTDTLGANEICLTSEWLRKVVSVEVLKSEPQPKLSGNEAKEFLQKVSNNNLEND